MTLSSLSLGRRCPTQILSDISSENLVSRMLYISALPNLTPDGFRTRNRLAGLRERHERIKSESEPPHRLGDY
jgi:hypothetical protein